MKKLIAMLLALSMLFTLCACGNEVEPEETEVPVPPVVVDTLDEEQKLASVDEDAFTVEDFKIDRVDNGYVHYELKVRNNTDIDADWIGLYYQIVDKHGDALVNASYGSMNLLARQSIWILFTDKLSDCEDGVTLRIVSYVVKNSLGVTEAKFNHMPEFDFTQQLAAFIAPSEVGNALDKKDPIEDNKKASAEDNDSKDPIAVEEVVIKKSNATIGVKVRNNSEEFKEVIKLGLQMLDSAGDVLSATEIYAYNLESGQAGRTDFNSIECNLADVASVKVINYSYGTGTNNAKTFPANSKHNMNNPIIIPIEDVIIQ